LYTPDGNKVTYLSTEGNADKSKYDLWSIDPQTREKVRLSNFENSGFLTNSKFDWAQSGDEVYLDGAYDIYRKDIYKFSIGTKQLTPIVVSKWNDQYPSISPDNNSLAFVSNRSGEDELWVLNLTTSKLRQVTGEAGYEFDSRYTDTQWLDNARILIRVYEGTKAVAVVINLDN
jgi:TolB protein